MQFSYMQVEVWRVVQHDVDEILIQVEVWRDVQRDVDETADCFTKYEQNDVEIALPCQDKRREKGD